LDPGAAAAIVKTKAVEFFPLGDGLATVMRAVPADTTFAAGTLAVSCVVLTYVVVSGTPFQHTTAPERKLVPSTVRERPIEPAVAVAGEIETMEGPVPSAPSPLPDPPPHACSRKTEETTRRPTTGHRHP
jgi:hypothetical protein